MSEIKNGSDAEAPKSVQEPVRGALYVILNPVVGVGLFWLALLETLLAPVLRAKFALSPSRRQSARSRYSLHSQGWALTALQPGPHAFTIRLFLCTTSSRKSSTASGARFPKKLRRHERSTKEVLHLPLTRNRTDAVERSADFQSRGSSRWKIAG